MIYDRIRSKGVQFSITPYTVPVCGIRVRPSYIFGLLRKQSFTTVYIRPEITAVITFNHGYNQGYNRQLRVIIEECSVIKVHHAKKRLASFVYIFEKARPVDPPIFSS
jgi:hypothetical protein